ncbi:alpha/beta fold hydrolase [Sulfitobacter sp.]|uniref:alpha/beta fold hydrolase n=1 Tax=Sulfitobacter sp. TaxID=1903071 RepID=UPI003F6BAD7B|tara:strand:+ start:154 stop:1557 length:1404 start_codon:yes stop_codon:yes gene_type:complete
MERRLAAVLVADMVGYSRLMEGDEDGVLARQKTHRRQVIDPEISRYRGRIIKTTGDGMLAEFSSAQDAVQCAIDIQTEMAQRETDQDEHHRIKYRVGINLGDVIFDDNDIFGDGVNVAARLEGLAEPGGVCISDIVHQAVKERDRQPFRDMGRQRVKNISRPILVWQWTPDAPIERKRPDIALQQRIQYCTSEDGTRIAWAGIGQGSPVLKAPNYLNHIEYEWGSPIWGPFLAEFARQNHLVRFDQRGNGLSDWEVDTISFDTMTQDMEAVVAASGLERFALFGISQGAGFSLRYALEHPEKVSCLILFGGFARGPAMRNNPEYETFRKTARVMFREGWGSPNPIYRQFFASGFMPDAPKDVRDSFDELQRISCSPENAMRIFEMNSQTNVIDIARQIDIPTLVLHIEGDQLAPIEEGQLLARSIPGAQFVKLPGNSHVALESEPCFNLFFEEVHAFITEHAGKPAP